MENHLLSSLPVSHPQTDRGRRVTAVRGDTDAPPAAAPQPGEGFAATEESRSMQLRFCQPMLPAGSWERPGCGARVGKEGSAGDLGAVQICRVCGEACASPPDAASLHQPKFPPHPGRGSWARGYDEAGEVGRRPRAGSSLRAASGPAAAGAGSSGSSGPICICFSCHFSGKN